MILRHSTTNVPVNYSENKSKKVDKMETQRILDEMKKMKEEIIQDRVSKDQAIMDRIGEINDNLTTTVTSNTSRITDLEDSSSDFKRDIKRLSDELELVKECNVKLNDKLLNSVAHSRRLNLHFLGHNEMRDEEENVIVKVNHFLVNTLRLDPAVVNAMQIRDAHRLGAYKANSKYPRPIIVGYVRMSDRNLIYSNAFRCKGTNYALRADLPPELVEVRNVHLNIRKEILKDNPDALCSCSYRNYRPSLIVKYRGKVQAYNSEMNVMELEAGDPRE